MTQASLQNPYHLLNLKEAGKREKYQEKCEEHGITLLPFAMETSGRLGESAFKTLKQVVTKGLEYLSDEGPAASQYQVRYLVQRLSCCLFSANADLILAASGRRRHQDNLRFP